MTSLSHELTKRNSSFTSRSRGWLAGSLGGMALLALASCGGSDGGSASCGDTASCGGDLVGSWKVTSSCIKYTDTSMTDLCANTTVDASKLKFDGSITYNADKTYSSTSTISGTIAFNFPSSCLSQGGQSVSCDSLGALLTLAFSSDPESPFSGGSCKAASGGCGCSFTFKPTTSQETGTYVTSGSTLTETSSTGEVTSQSFCAKGTTLTEHSDGTMAGQEGVTGTIVLTKQ